MKLRAKSAFGLALLLALLLPLNAQPRRHATTPQLVVLDADVGDDIDDAFAIALALRSPQFHILGISTAFGDTELRAHLFARLLTESGDSAVPIAVGIPTHASNKFSQAAYARADQHPTPSLRSVDFLLAQASAHPGQITLIALGPLINIGAAIDRDPVAFRKFKRVVVMSGSFQLGYTGGDPAKHPPAAIEWNARQDPSSLRKLLTTGVPVYLMPLDSTQIALPPAGKERIAAQTDGLSQALTELYREYGKQAVLYDAVTVAYALDPSFCPADPMHVEVDDKGFTRTTDGSPNAHVCMKAKDATFLQLFEHALLRQASGK